MPTSPVRCCRCGFLALRRKKTRELMEAESCVRDLWQWPVDFESKLSVYESVPLCFAQVPGFVPTKEGISVDRECERFVTWRQGHTPKEHQDMIDRAELQRFQAEQRDKDRQFQVDLNRSNRMWNLWQALFMLGISALVSWFVSSR